MPLVTAKRPPVSVRVYSKTFAPLGDIGSPKFVTVQPRHLAVGTCTIGVIGSHRMVQYLDPDSGGRLVLRDEFGDYMMGGYIDKLRMKGPTAQSLVEVDIKDDYGVLNEMLGWVIPAAGITGQGTAGEYWTMTDSAETVLKAAVTANATRLGLPITCATDLGRGTTIKASLRFHPLLDRLIPTVDGAGFDKSGLGITVRQSGAGLVVDVYETSQYPRDLTEAGGAITEWSLNKSAATATRAVIGGPGDGIFRTLREQIDSTRETSLNRVIERFRDARDVDPGDVPTLYERGQDTIDEGAAKSGVSMSLRETANFRYGRSVRVGDKVTVKLGGKTITNVLTEATLSWTRDAGWKATPKVGDITDSADKTLARSIRHIVRWVSNSQRT